jgi:hypothetical protein
MYTCAFLPALALCIASCIHFPVQRCFYMYQISSIIVRCQKNDVAKLLRSWFAHEESLSVFPGDHETPSGSITEHSVTVDLTGRAHQGNRTKHPRLRVSSVACRSYHMVFRLRTRPRRPSIRPSNSKPCLPFQAHGSLHGQDKYDHRRHPHHIVHLYLVVLSSSWAGTGCASVFVCTPCSAISKFRKFVVCSWMLVERIDASRRM